MRQPQFVRCLTVVLAVFFANRSGLTFGEYTQPRQVTGVEIPVLSPDGRFEIFYNFSEQDSLEGTYQQHQIWLRSRNTKGKPALLYSYGRDANVAWSPDSRMIAVTDFEGSNSSRVVLFRIVPPLGATRLSEIDNFIEVHAKEMLPDYDHFYAEVVGWTIDSGSLAIELRGDVTEWDLTQTEYTTRRISRQAKFRIP